MLALSACSAGSPNDTDDGGDTQDPITLAYVDGWTDGESMTFLLKNQLEKIGYEVEVQTLTDLGPMYAALANGDVDIYSSAWSDVTDASYMEELGHEMETVGVWYENAKLTIAVPSYSEIDSMEELADNADLFDNGLIGIEPGAGATEIVETSMMPAYGIEDWSLSTSSTAAMLTVLGEAVENEDEVAVTLWRPFWANSEYDVKDLEDPAGAMGESENLNVLGHKGFSEEYPEAAELIEGLQLDDAEYGPLEMLISSDDYEGDPEGAVDEWLSEHPDAFSTQVD